MRITFDLALDGASWPGPLGHANFVFGEAWLGPLGLLDLLEMRLGLAGVFDGQLERACRLAVDLRDRQGYWRSSFDVDPLATCRRLLRDRDQLRMWGWRGQPVSARLTELHGATAGAAPGLPERLEAVARVLSDRSSGIESVVSYTVIDRLPQLWRVVFEALRRTGVLIEERTLTPASAVGDLSGVRAMGFTPTGDGRLCLLRGHGPLDAADEIAASLAASDSLDGIVIIGPDHVLDQALARHGLPRVGGSTGPPASSRLLSLVLEAAFQPMSMGDLHALLAADPGPIPRHLAARLIDALCQCPGRRTPEWSDALANGLSRVTDERREEVERRVTTLLDPVCGRNAPLPVTALRDRLAALDTWARARAAFAPSLLELSRGIHTLLESVDLLGMTALSYHDLRRLCGDLGPSWTWTAAQAGLAHVAHPGAILGPARAIVWWNFSRESAPRPERMVLSGAERDALRAAGVEPPDPALAITVEAEAWRRPLEQVRDTLILACPLTDPSGERSHPHPLWDDVTAAMANAQDAAKLEHDRLVRLAPANLVTVAPRPLVTPVEVVNVSSPIVLREVESPSSLETLLGCPLAWMLHYTARLKSGLAAGPQSPGPLLFGSLAHRILAQVLARGLVSENDAAEAAGSLFDEQSSNLCEDLSLPQHQAARATVRRAVVESARSLVALARKHRPREVRTELSGETSIEGQTVRGRLDVVWSEPDVVLDLKWGKSAYVEKVETGTAIQLAAYAAMRAPEGRSVETAYFVLQNQDVLAGCGGRLAEDARVQGLLRASETWSSTATTLRDRRDSLAAGRIEAPGAMGNDLDPSCSPAGVQIAAPCRYCEFPSLCGRQGAR
jgi:RecB family exonuclease